MSNKVDNKKVNNKTEKCSPNCIWFPQEPDEIISEEVIDGVKYRHVVRRCAYTGSVITNETQKCEHFNAERGR